MTKLAPIMRFNSAFGNFDDIFDNFLGLTARPDRYRTQSDQSITSTIPRANVYEGEEGYTIQIAAPGFSREDFNVKIENNQLTVSARIEKSHSIEENDNTHREFNYTNFSRSWTLPSDVNVSAVNAGYESGILSLDIPVEGKSSSVIDVAVD
tara:strand:- start:66 stop:521 length:456 start_codon:yes stop_codon:yes gene_type:complete